MISLAGLLLLASLSYGQKPHKLRSSNLILEGRAYYGFTMAHHLEMQSFQRHYPAFELSVFKATYGKTRWEYMYNYPFVGLAYWYSDLGNTRWLGSAHAIFPYVNFPLIKQDIFTFSFRLGFGLGYLTKPYHRIENYKNLAIGSHMNGAVNLMFEARWKAGPKLMVAGGVSLTHFSNGTVKTPNYGLNIPSVNLAFAYRLTRENPYLRSKLYPRLESFEFDGKKRIWFDVSVGGAVKDMQSQLGVGNRFGVITIFGNVMKQISYKSKLGLGLDLSYDDSDIVILEQRGHTPEGLFKVMKSGVTVAYELSFADAAIMLNAGSYLGGQEKSDGDVYEKIAIRYQLTDEIFATLMLKAHYARADFVALCIGYKFEVFHY